jgi:CDP-2,3-bis-(O-geranylgeranyl)-sn-glycerol synthase
VASIAVLKLLVLLLLANGAPLAAKKLFGSRWSYPVDANLAFIDGRPLVGRTKTIRGLVFAIAAATAAAPLLGLDWTTGLVAGAAAMAGDLFSSFVKRRLDLDESSQAIGLDQIPESLFPLLACREAMALGVAEIVAGVAVFFVGELLISRLLYALHLRDRPY